MMRLKKQAARLYEPNLGVLLARPFAKYFPKGAFNPLVRAVKAPLLCRNC